MRAPATLSVQIVNYHTRSYLERCLPTVVADLQRSGIEFELNLLDNDSGERLEDLAPGFPNCRAFVAPRNLGFGGGHNLLAGRTEAPHLWIVNPDVEVISPDAARRLLATITSCDQTEAAGPKLLTAAGAAQPYDHGRLHGARAQIALRGGHSYWRQTDTPQTVAWVSGAALMIERAAFMALGGFDENLFLYKEEEDLCLRLRSAGGRVVYEPAVRLRHRGSVVADRTREIELAQRYFIAKHCRRRRAQKLFAATHQGLAYLRL